MITYEMIDKKIDSLLEQGKVVHWDFERDRYYLDSIAIDDEERIYVGHRDIEDDLPEYNPHMVKYLYKKLEKAHDSFEEFSLEEAINYLTD